MYNIEREKIDEIIKGLEEIKKNDENITITINSGLQEAVKTFDSVYFKRYVDINIEFNDFLEGENYFK